MFENLKQYAMERKAAAMIMLAGIMMALSPMVSASYTQKYTIEDLLWMCLDFVGAIFGEMIKKGGLIGMIIAFVIVVSLVVMLLGLLLGLITYLLSKIGGLAGNIRVPGISKK